MDPGIFEHELKSRLSRVEEFREIAAKAKELGVRIWLFGGTASAYAHYVKWDLMREAGDKRFTFDTSVSDHAIEHRFDYEYLNIFRSTQDLDLAADGMEAKVESFKVWIANKFPYAQGNKLRWEVRPLRTPHYDKYAILDDPGFQNQHTDSHSTGLIEVTNDTSEPVVRDARDWQAKGPPQFLRDVMSGQLHFYASDLHWTTRRFQDGLNPPIFAAIRYLTKAFQFELQIDPESLKVVQSIIEHFDPPKDLKKSEAKEWIEKNGKRLFQNAVNLEYAWNTLEKLGLRKKLITLGNPKHVDSLAWWMNKEPLRTGPIGIGAGATADSLGISVVSHETSDILAYEAMTRA